MPGPRTSVSTSPTATSGSCRRPTLFYAAANRDPAVFAEPHRFDPARDPNPHVGFGSKGPHFCLGAHLARRELAVTFRKVFEQLPDLEVTGPPARLRSSFVNGLKRLPARLGGAA